MIVRFGSNARPPASARALLARVLRRNAGALTGCFVLLSIWQLSEAMVSVVVGEFIDHAVVAGDVGALVEWGLLLALVFAALMLCYRYGALIAYRVDQPEANQLRVEVAEHVLRPDGARTGRLPGEVLSLATSDADGVGTLAQSTGNTVASAVAVLVSAAVLIRIDLAVGLTVLFGVPLVLFVTQLITPAISRRSREQRNQIAATGAAAADLVRGLRVVKGIGAEDEATARYRQRSQVARSAGIRVAGSQALMTALSTGLSGLFLAAVTLLAGKRALEHHITIGQLIAIVGLTQFLSVPILTLGKVGALVADGHASAARIVDFLHTPPLLSAGSVRPPRSAAPELALDEVTVGELTGFCLDSGPGELLCLVLEDPAVARTLVRLLTGEIPAEDIGGEVRLDGTILSSLSLPARRERLLINPHQTDLLHGTLRSNLDPDGRHTDADLARFLAAAAAHDIVRLADDGLDQPVTARGDTYSGGQRQRIALARALAADSAILVLDNPTTAVDAVTEQQIALGIRTLRHRSGARTTWVLTTSPALLAQADRVVYARGGRVAAVGTHRELLARSDYQDLVLR